MARRTLVDILRALRTRAQGRRAMAARAQALKTGARPLPAPQKPLLETALVIPAHADQAGLDHLLEQARVMECFAQVIVVDDASPIPLTAPGATLIRHPGNQGAGAARNTGLDAVTAPYLLFFDADDHLTDDLPPLLADLAAAAPFDVCLFKHADSRLTAQGRWGQSHSDERWWQDAGLAEGACQDAPPATWPLLARTQNYPWNKVLRTGFLRDNGIRSGTTQVHNDIALHWWVFLAASRILTSDRICALHQVQDSGLTSTRGPERLQVFEALAPIAQAVADREPEWQAALADFTLDVVDWNRKRITPAHLEALNAAEADFLARHMRDWATRIAPLDPGLAKRLP